MKFRVDIVESKNKIFLHVLKGDCTENMARQKIKEQGYEAINLVSKSDNVFIFDIKNNKPAKLQQIEVNMTDLTESYGASELPVFNLQEEKPKTPRKTTARKPRARRKTATTKKQTEN